MTSSALPARRPRLRRLSGYVVILIALGVIGVLYAALAPAGHAANGTTSQREIQRGHDLFLQSCASCHGFNAEGGNRAPSLIGVGAAAVDFQVGTGRMPLANHGPQAPQKHPAFGQTDIDALAAYVASLAPGPAAPQDVGARWKQGDLAEGGELFRTNCAQCHQVVGQGGALTYGKYAPGLKNVTPKQMYEAMLTGPESMPTFGDKTLTPQQKYSIIKYLKSVKNEANPGGFGIGRIGPVSEGLVAWLIGIGGLVGVTLWIGQRL